MKHDRRPIRLPRTGSAPVLRTDFTDPAGWARLLRALETPVTFEEGSPHFCDYDRAIAYVVPVDKEKFRDLSPETVLAGAPRTGHDLSYDHLYLADAQTFVSDELPLLGIDLHVDNAGDEPCPREEPFRVPALHVAGVEINVSIANVFFREYHDSDWSELDAHVAEPGTAVYEEFRRMDQEEGDQGDEDED
ncbi:DUF6924 domain-containing protein [Streptomyces sp. URMC 126]|uniref:DUF6924 domain-containing protein n=1 Tax=Streptomyces sp. URMC 126 TaxID=3423401 RepID=UPI003F1AE683